MAKTQRPRTLVALDAAREALDEAREALTATVGTWTPTTSERSDEAREALGEAMSILSSLDAALEERAAQTEPARGNGQLVPTKTRHSGTCETDGAFGRYDMDCARCRELDAGAPPRRGWGPGRYG